MQKWFFNSLAASFAFNYAFFSSSVHGAPLDPSSSPTPFTPVKLYSPKPNTDNYFGAENYFYANNRRANLWRNSFLELSNSRLAVIDPFYDEERGAVHIFDMKTGRVLNSVVGDHVGTLLGSGGIYKLQNGNFLISSPFDDDIAKNFQNSGSLKLYDTAKNAVTVTLKGQTSWELFSGLDTPTAPVRDFVKVSKSGRIVVASPMASYRAGKILILNPEDLSIVTTINGSPGHQLGSGGLLALTQNDIVVVASPLVTHPSCTNCGQITFLDMAKAQIASLYPFWGNFYVEMLWPNVRLGSGEMKELSDGSVAIANLSDSAKGIKNVGSIAAINWKLRPYSDCVSGAAARNKNFHTNSVRFITGSLENDQFGFANAITGERSITPISNGLIVGSPNLQNGNRIKTGVIQIFDNILSYKGGISGAFAEDRFGEKVLNLSNGNFLALTPYMDANSNAGGSIKNIGMVYLLSSSNAALTKMIYQGVPNLRLGLYGALPLSNGDFVYDSGNKISFASGTTGIEKKSLNIKASISAEGPNATAFIDLQQNRMAVMSARTNDPLRSGNGGLFIVNTKSMLIENSVFQDSLRVNLGYAGIATLSTGELLIFNPTDSSRGISNAGSIWIIPMK